jgi:hypothetical protein
MSGAEIIGLISGIITLIDASVTIYKALEGGPSLPLPLRDSIARLPLIQDSLILVKRNFNGDASSAASQAALKQVLEACAGRATELRDISQAMIPPTDASKLTRSLITVKAMSKASHIDKLAGGIMDDLHVLTANHAIKAATRTQVEALMAEIKQREGKIQEGTREAVSVPQTGPGKQYVYNGVGNQNIASDNATQINGTCHGATFNFSHG